MNQNLSVMVLLCFFSSWRSSRKRIGTPATLLLWLHSIYFSSICKGLWHFPSGSETVCPFSLLQHWDYRAVCASPHNRRGGFNFSGALETDFGFSEKKKKSAMLGAPHKRSRCSSGLRRLEQSAPIFHFITYANIRLPLSPLQQVSRW